MKYIILLIPFVFELFGDWYLIKHGKKDITLCIRVILVLLFSAIWPEAYVRNAVYSAMWFCFFDPLLNLLRGKKWFYNGQTKGYDKFIAKFNPYFVLSARILIFILCLVYVIWL